MRFHNGDSLTAEDVKFSFDRYKGGGATTLKARVAAVEIVDAQRIRFRMKQPWPDFMTFYATPATSAAWIVPKNYMERAAFYKADQEKQFKYLVRVGSGAAGNAATRIEAFVISGGIRSYGGYPDIDALFRDQAVEMDPRRREALLHRIQQLMHERAMFAPIVEQVGLIGVGPRLAEVPSITGHPFISPYEDLMLKGASP